MKVIRLKNSPYDANAYLVDGKILVDVGMDAHAILSQLEKLIEPGELETIILTHCHYDHSGEPVRWRKPLAQRSQFIEMMRSSLTIQGAVHPNFLGKSTISCS